MDDLGSGQTERNQLNTTFEYNDLPLYAMAGCLLGHNHATVERRW